MKDGPYVVSEANQVTSTGQILEAWKLRGPGFESPTRFGQEGKDGLEVLGERMNLAFREGRDEGKR